jgi:hypothetical protein
MKLLGELMILSTCQLTLRQVGLSFISKTMLTLLGFNVYACLFD